MDSLTRILIDLESELLGSTGFLVFSAVITLVLCFVAIPWSTDAMVNNIAGLVGKYGGRRYRTLVINASTNNPEALAMGVSFCLGLMGGWATPVGSLFANCYLMYLFAPLWVLGRLAIRSGPSPRRLLEMLWLERGLVLWHVALGLLLMSLGRLSLSILKGDFAPPSPGEATHPLTGGPLILALGLLIVAIVVFAICDRRIHRRRPELFEEIHDEHHGESWSLLIVGTVILVACCWLINSLFLSWTHLYEGQLEELFGETIFLWLNFFLGALITSLPELRVATRNYGHLAVPDLHTALGSATYSNYVNLWISFLGLSVFAILALFGHVLPWGA